MEKSEQFRHHAGECRKLASQASNEEQRKQLTTMAETWEQLAAERDRLKNNLQVTGSAASQIKEHLTGIDAQERCY
jgi:hypothetical protein